MRNGVAYVDLQTQLPEEFLLMTDRFSMAHSLEARTPFLDHIFAERVLSIPPHIRTRPGSLKYLLKRAVGHLLPAELLNAQKRGFVIPDTLWLRGKLRPLVERLLGPERLAQQGLLHPQVYHQFVLPHLERRADFTGQVWTLLMFQLWYAVFIEAKAISAPSFSWRDLI
jgi:asparagine synthase (glutamine-hydrolysing)